MKVPGNEMRARPILNWMEAEALQASGAHRPGKSAPDPAHPSVAITSRTPTPSTLAPSNTLFKPYPQPCSGDPNRARLPEVSVLAELEARAMAEGGVGTCQPLPVPQFPGGS